MHLLRVERRGLEEAESAVDLEQTPADLVFLSFSDAELGALAQAAQGSALSVRLASLAELKHPYSVDLYVEKVVARSRFVLARIIGGLDYWRYGVEEASAAARAHGVRLALLPGEGAFDERLAEFSTVPAQTLRELGTRLTAGGPDALKGLLADVEAQLCGAARPFAAPAPAAPEAGEAMEARRETDAQAPRALIVFYRSAFVARDMAPVLALADALAARRFDVEAAFVSSLKADASIAFLRARFAARRPDVIVNATGFSARREDAGSALDKADAPVLQVAFSGATRAQWEDDPRGLSAADLAMNVVLPEIDGRIIARAVAVKEQGVLREDVEFSPRAFAALPGRVDFVADLAANWARLRRLPRAEKRIALILSDYPGKPGRSGYAVGLDTGESVAVVADALRRAGYDVGALPPGGEIVRALEAGAELARLPLAQHEQLLDALNPDFVAQVKAQWGDPAQEARDGAFAFPALLAGNVVVALQPGRAREDERKSAYHDVSRQPRHGFIAFYLWLRHVFRADAIVHCGAHGALEWLPGKANALSAACAPEALLGPTPLVYPFIVNNPGEAAQAKRRAAAVTIGHLTPPLVEAGLYGHGHALEALLDEYADAAQLDPKRARALAAAILEEARRGGLSRDCGLSEDDDEAEALRKLDAFLCDVKEMRIGDGLHVFGRSPLGEARAAVAACFGDAPEALARIDACGRDELAALLGALDGRFVEPGPGGAPSRGRLDALPTGRNIFSIDPRAAPTRAAYEIGRRAADETLRRHAQDHGDWPKRLVMDLWASPTMRSGGDEFAQALALIGARPLWDDASSRVTGFEILPPAMLGRPRVDVALRISGMFRDAFPGQIALFDQAAQAIAALDEDDSDNPLAARMRASGRPPESVFGAAPGAYGLQLSRALEGGGEASREELGQLYLAATSHAYGGPGGQGRESAGFTQRVADADALVHVQDQVEQDLFESDAKVDHVGGFFAAAQALGAAPRIYVLDARGPQAPKARSLDEEAARLLRGRAANPRWLEGQMRHGHRGAAEIAETVDHVFALAVMSDAIRSEHFDLMFEAVCAEAGVADFLIAANPQAAGAIFSRFDQAARRGLWRPRRNAPLDELARLMDALSC
ncbi:cobaltochelatase subunit CobN [Methylocella sp.]|uniref:cobaltochelatase subunit CobN n=1 Tax=Methylocella sp. TaxID=1978226 RepID=UPI0035B35F69